jgi:hypothetical protein
MQITIKKRVKKINSKTYKKVKSKYPKERIKRRSYDFCLRPNMRTASSLPTAYPKPTQAYPAEAAGRQLQKVNKILFKIIDTFINFCIKIFAYGTRVQTFFRSFSVKI